MVRSVEEALALREAGIGQICMGEVRGRAPPGFDFGNSPFEISNVDIHGKTIIQRTSTGTQGIVAASRATDFRRSRWSPQRRPPAPFFPVHPIRSLSSPWATPVSGEQTKTNCAQSTFATGSKAG